MAHEVEHLKQEIAEWVTKKSDALEIVTTLMVKFDLKPQDWVDAINKLNKKEGRR